MISRGLFQPLPFCDSVKQRFEICQKREWKNKVSEMP